MTSPGMAYWADAVFYRDRMEENAYAQMIAHPRFSEACHYAARMAVERHIRNRAVSRVLRDMRRLFLALLVFYIDSRGAVTLASVREFCAELGLYSANSAVALLLQLRALGFIARGPLMPDGRTRRYLPNPEMRSAIVEIFRTEIEAFAMIEPQAAGLAEALDDPEVFRQFMIRTGIGLVRVAKTKTTNPMSLFAERASGIAILQDIATSGVPENSYPPDGQVNISVKKIAQKFGLSRSHVLRLFRAAEKQGLIKRNSDETTGLILKPLLDELRYFHALSCVSAAVCADYAVRQVKGLREAV